MDSVSLHSFHGNLLESIQDLKLLDSEFLISWKKIMTIHFSEYEFDQFWAHFFVS